MEEDLGTEQWYSGTIQEDLGMEEWYSGTIQEHVGMEEWYLEATGEELNSTLKEGWYLERVKHSAPSYTCKEEREEQTWVGNLQICSHFQASIL